MSALVTEEQYADWAAVVGLSPAPDGLADALLWASDDVRQFCGRTFAYSPADGGADEARVFAGDDTPTLIVDDLLEIASVSCGGTYFPRGVGASPYEYLILYTESWPNYWSRVDPVTVTGQWGYAATLPPVVVEAACMLAAVRILGEQSWVSGGGVKRVTAGIATVEYDTSVVGGLATKRNDAYGKLAGFARIEMEPHL